MDLKPTNEMTHKTLIKISLLLVLMLTGPLSAAYAQKGAAMKEIGRAHV